MEVYIEKSRHGEVWESLFKDGPKLNEEQMGRVKRNVMIERFQGENPGFDFRNAEFNGEVPDPNVFMGGVTRD